MTQHIVRTRIARIPNTQSRKRVAACCSAVIDALEPRTLFASSNLLVNGDFENEPNFAASVDGYGVNGHGNTLDNGFSLLTGRQIPGWTIAEGSGATVHVNPGPYPVLGGVYGVNVDGEGFGGGNCDIYQDFQTTDGQSYTLSFDWASWMSPVASGLGVTLSDTATHASLFLATYTFDQEGGHVSADFTGTGHTVRLEIQEVPQSGTNDNNFNVDNFVVAASGRQLAIKSQPVDTMAGAKLAPVSVAFVDDQGATIDTADGPITVEAFGSAGNLRGKTTIKAVAGIATFSDLSITGPGTDHLVFSDSGGNTIQSADFHVLCNVKFLKDPRGGTTGDLITPAIKVAITDVNGKTCKDSFGTFVTLEVTGRPTEDLLRGNVSQSSNGIANFGGLIVKKAGTYTLTATPNIDVDVFGGTAISKEFTIVGPQFKFSKPPKDVDDGEPITFTVAVLDYRKKVDKEFVGNAGILLQGPEPSTDQAQGSHVSTFVGGYATFNGTLAYTISNAPGKYHITAQSTDANGAVLDDDVGSAVADFEVKGLHLKFSKEPRDTDVKAPIDFAIAVLNSKNKVVKDFTGFVSVTPNGALETPNPVPHGPAAVAVVGGYATFTGSTAFTIEKAGDYDFNAKTSDATGADVTDPVETTGSRIFKINGLHLKMSKEPRDGDIKAPIDFAIAVLNSKNKVVKDYSGFVTVEPGGSEDTPNPERHGPAAVAFVGGYATFTGSTAFTIDRAGSYFFNAHTSDSAGVEVVEEVEQTGSRIFKINGFHLKFSNEPRDTDVNTAIDYAVEVLNSKNTTVKDYSGFIRVYAFGALDTQNPASNGPFTAAVVGGFATFDNGNALQVPEPGTYFLEAKVSDSVGLAIDADVDLADSRFFKVTGIS